MAAVSSASSPITQVSQQQAPAHANLQPQLLTRLLLDLRGQRFAVDRETIMNLPESVLLCLFPNGLVLSRQSMALSEGGENEDEEEVYGVDVCISTSSLSCVQSADLPSSLTQSASNLCSISFAMHRTHSMGLPRHRACLLRSNILRKILPRRSSVQSCSVPCSPSKQSSFFAKSSSISQSLPRMESLPRMQMGLPAIPCWISSESVARSY